MSRLRMYFEIGNFSEEIDITKIFFNPEFKQLLIGAWWRDAQMTKGADDGETQTA